MLLAQHTHCNGSATRNAGCDASLNLLLFVCCSYRRRYHAVILIYDCATYRNSAMLLGRGPVHCLALAVLACLFPADRQMAPSSYVRLFILKCMIHSNPVSIDAACVLALCALLLYFMLQ